VRAPYSRNTNICTPARRFFLAAILRKSGAARQPPMAYFEETADLRSDEPDKVAEIILWHCDQNGAIWQALYR
jgi:hypothetical protein